MKKQELLNYFDGELMDKLFGFCYARTDDSYEVQEPARATGLSIIMWALAISLTLPATAAGAPAMCRR